jgi:hypothetical protein
MNRGLAGLVAHIKSNANSDANCTYICDGWYTRSFALKARLAKVG